MVFLSIVLAFCININAASPEELEQIKHIGEARAGQIAELRKEKLFSSLDDLSRVIGLGPSRISDIKKQGLACVNPQQRQEEKTLKQKVELAAAGNLSDVKQDGRRFYLFLAALPLALFSGFAILLLKKHVGTFSRKNN